jgi:hemoglobin-like flavoprotein
MRYANILGYSLGEIFDETSMLDLLLPESEEQLLDQVETAIDQLKAKGKPLLPRNLADLMAMSKNGLKQYPRVKKLFNQWERERQQDLLGSDSEREESLLKQIEPLLQQLEPTGSPLLLEHVCHLVGLTYRWTIRKYPRIKTLFQEYQKNGLGPRRAPPLDEETKVREVQAAINLLLSHGEPVTLRRLREVVKLTSSQLKISSRIKALLRSHTEKRPGEVF